MTLTEARNLKRGEPVLIHARQLLLTGPRGWKRAEVVAVTLCECTLCKKVPVRDWCVHVTIRVHDRIWRTAGRELRRATPSGRPV